MSHLDKNGGYPPLIVTQQASAAAIDDDEIDKWQEGIRRQLDAGQISDYEYHEFFWMHERMRSCLK